MSCQGSIESLCCCPKWDPWRLEGFVSGSDLLFVYRNCNIIVAFWGWHEKRRRREEKRRGREEERQRGREEERQRGREEERQGGAEAKRSSCLWFLSLSLFSFGAVPISCLSLRKLLLFPLLKTPCTFYRHSCNAKYSLFSATGLLSNSEW